MERSTINDPPRRVTDLIMLKKNGADIMCHTEFEILPVDFSHRSNPFQAYIFLCLYVGAVNEKEFLFRKCYARGCPHNLCPHVSQAVMIANRYLHRDYQRLETCGIDIEKRMFTLEDMTVKFNGYHEEHGPILAIHDYINIAKEGNEVSIDILLEYVPAVEHFVNLRKKQTFLMVDFTIAGLGRSGHYERCLACYPTEEEKAEKQKATAVANERLRLLYQEFDDASIIYEKCFFE
jgi:hypothetical protein